MKNAFLFLMLISFSACSQNTDKQGLKTLLNQTHFNKQVIAHISQYQNFKKLVLSNLDTIFKFRNSRNIIDSYKGNKVSKKQEDNYTYDFLKNDYPKSKLSEQLQFENMPAKIYPAINKMFNALAPGKIEGFSLSKDSTIEIIFKKCFDEKTGLTVNHRLAWHKRKLIFMNDPNLPTVKDTLLSNGWVYYIAINTK